MASQLLLATATGEPHRLRLAAATSAAGSLVAEVGYALGALPPRGDWLSEELVLASGDWVLTVADLRALEPLLLERGLRLVRVEAPAPEALVAAASLGLVTQLQRPDDETAASTANKQASPSAPQAQGLTIHQGTLRSGDHLQVDGSVLLLGDVNPGARISAAGSLVAEVGYALGALPPGGNGSARSWCWPPATGCSPWRTYGTSNRCCWSAACVWCG